MHRRTFTIRQAVCVLIALLLGACTNPAPNVKTWGGLGSEPGQFNEPFDVAVDHDGFFYVTDVRNKRVQVCDSEGCFLHSIGGMGLWGGRFRVASGLVGAFD